MPHFRVRFLELAIRQSLGWSPSTAVFGQRQTGKTTLLKRLAGSYVTFDNPVSSQKCASEGRAFLDHLKPPRFLDEVHKFPPVFDLIKVGVDETKRPGLYLLSGSVRFAQRRQIRESLTGRTTLWELLPLTFSEAEERKFPDLFSTFTGKNPLNALKKRDWATCSGLERQMERGGLPGICFLRDSNQRLNALENHIATLMERDIDLVRSIRVSKGHLLPLLRDISSQQGVGLNLSALARKHRLSSPTVKNLLIAFEGLFLIRRHGAGYYFDDSGIAQYLSPAALSGSELSWRHLLFLELRAQALYRKESVVQFSEWQTRGGAWVPFVFELRSGVRIGFTFDPLDYPSEKSLKSLGSFRKRYPGAMCVAVHMGNEIQENRTGVFEVPLRALI